MSASRGKQRVALVLQGGGALGAYHVGAYKALHEAGYVPDIVAGISIGAINSALIAGNAPEARLDKLEAFWRSIEWPSVLPNVPELDAFHHYAGAAAAVLFGQPGFFAPRPLSPYLSYGAPCATSFCDTSYLRETLGRLVDFSHLEARKTRLLLGSVKVKVGQLSFFDSYKNVIRPEHIMASGALPPGFPGVTVDGDLYWDGGCASNTPLDGVLDTEPNTDLLVFMIDLFDAAGPEPSTMGEVDLRRTAIQYASRSTHHIDQVLAAHDLRWKLRQVLEALPVAESPGAKKSTVRKLSEHTRSHRLDIVHITYESPVYETAAKDHDFSPASLERRKQAGYEDLVRMLKESPWTQPSDPHVGARLHENRKRSGSLTSSTGEKHTPELASAASSSNGANGLTQH
jgi:NTE family protein